LIVKFIGLEVSAAVLPPPMLGIVPMLVIVPVLGLPGFVTVTGIVPGLAIADAGILAINWFGVKKVVVCCTPLKFTVAPEAKLLPLIVRVIPGPPAWALSGESSMMDGTTPGCDMPVLDCIDPHPTHRNMRKSKEINFMAYSNTALTFSGVYKRAKRRVSRKCHFLVKGMPIRLRLFGDLTVAKFATTLIDWDRPNSQ
jgi:hypothetical protein